LEILMEKISFSPDNNSFISLDADNTILLGNVASSNETRLIKYNNGNISTISFSPDGKYIYTNYEIWDMVNMRWTNSIFGQINYSIESICISTDGKYLAVGCNDDKIRIWDIVNQQRIRTFEGNSGKVNSVYFSNDGNFIIYDSSDYDYRLPDGGTLLGAGQAYQIRLWNTDGKEVAKLDYNTDYIKSVFVTPDNRFVLAADFEGKIEIWELDWELEFPDEVDWHKDAEPYVRNFLTLSNNHWTEEQFDQFYKKLQYAGLGWVKKEGVLRKMQEFAGMNN